MQTVWAIRHGVSSSIKTITYGIPQGPTLGPSLFLLYINDLRCMLSGSILQAILIQYSRVKKLGTIESVINNELKHLVQCLRGNKLSLNETKTEVIIYRTLWKQLLLEPGIRLNNCKLKLYPRVRYLGIFIDEVLS